MTSSELLFTLLFYTIDPKTITHSTRELLLLLLPPTMEVTEMSNVEAAEICAKIQTMIANFQDGPTNRQLLIDDMSDILWIKELLFPHSHVLRNDTKDEVEEIALHLHDNITDVLRVLNRQLAIAEDTTRGIALLERRGTVTMFMWQEAMR